MTSWAPQVFAPYPQQPDLLFARVAARSAAFETTSAAGGAPVLVGSAAGHDRDQVTLGARGELLERLGNVMAGREAEAAAELVGTREELRREGIPAVEPQVRADTRRLWVRGRTVRGAEVFVPAGAAFLHHRPPPGCDAAQSSGSTGLAAHPDVMSAARHAAWEVLERDLIRRSWYGLADRPPSLLPFAPPPALAGFLRSSGLTATAFGVPAPAGCACVVVCLHRPDGTGQAFGARCGPADNVGALAEKAAYEAVMVRWSMRTRVARRAWDEWHGTSPPVTAVQHALWTYHRQDSLGLWDVRPVPELRPGSGVRTDPLDVLAGHTGRDVILVESTSAPAREAGVRVVRLLAPGALPLPSAGHTGHPHPFG
ncbi:YcaO-like family protein [Streptomyces sp. NBC_00091]|uniref:YcaO-like family protein n=1 Tax=Streptomyces sp. NBC_00091 TaxID=2975648 RepID=UPI002255AC7E|nr:YcaO-like family protein [Streptomyces sp. NBC_00091]MCX5379739.1 YcaO-like family protein [Streptomyces sp. NBC_00091]